MMETDSPVDHHKGERQKGVVHIGEPAFRKNCFKLNFRDFGSIFRDFQPEPI